MNKQKRISKDNNVLRAFIKVYCRENRHNVTVSEARHSFSVDESNNGRRLLRRKLSAMTNDKPYELCAECAELLDYAVKRNEKCPLDPKPRCKKCHVHCYKPEMRRKIKEVMKFSGIYFLKRGRLDWVYKYFF